MKEEEEELTQEEHAEIVVGDAIVHNSEEAQRRKYGDKEYERRIGKRWAASETSFEERYGICDQGEDV